MTNLSYPALVGRNSGLLHVRLDHIEFVFDDPQAGESIHVSLASIKIELHPGNIDQFSIHVPGTINQKIYFENTDLIKQLERAGSRSLQPLSKKLTKRRFQVLAKFVVPLVTILLLVVGLPLVVSYLPSAVLNRLISRQTEEKIGKLWIFAYEDTTKSQTQINAEYSMNNLANIIKVSNPDLDHIKLDVVISQSDIANAYALPGGVVVVNSQLIMQAESVEEILGVLAHEFAHIEKRHNMKSLTSGLGFILGQAFISVIFGQEAAKVVTNSLGIATLKYSRHNETEADERAFEYLRNAGVSAQGFIDFFQRANSEAGRANSRLAAVLSTHPAPMDRINKMIELSKKSPSNAKKEFSVALQDLKVF